MPIRVEYGTVTLTVTGLPRVFCSRSPPPADPAAEPVTDSAAADIWVFTAPQQHRPGPSRAEPGAELSPAAGWAEGSGSCVPACASAMSAPVLVSVLVSVFAVVSPFVLPAFAGAWLLPVRSAERR